MIQLAAIIIKETKLLLRDPAALLMLFVLPAMFILVLSVALQGAFSSGETRERVDVLVVNQDRGELGSKLIEELSEAGRFRIVTEVDGRELTLSEAEGLLGEGRYKIGVAIPPEASESIELEAQSAIKILVDPALSEEFASMVRGTMSGLVFDQTVEQLRSKTDELRDAVEELEGTTEKLEKTTRALEETTECLEDAVNRLKTKLDDVKVRARRAMYLARTKGQVPEGLTNLGGSEGLEIDCPRPEKAESGGGGDGEEAAEEVEEEPAVGLAVTQSYVSSRGRTVRPNSVQQSVPGWTIFALFWIVQILAVNIINDRSSGAFKRVLVAPITLWRYLAAKTVPFFVINMLQAVAMFAIGTGVLPLLGLPRLELTNLGALALLTFGVSLASLCFGLLMASISRTLFFVAAFSTLLLIIMAVLGGIMVPKVIMPSTMQQLSLYVPHGWALDGYLDVLVRGFGVREVLKNFGALMGFAAGFFVLALVRFRKMSLEA